MSKSAPDNIDPSDSALPEALNDPIGFEDGFNQADLAPTEVPQEPTLSPPAPQQSSDSIPAELAPPPEYNSGDSFVDLRAPIGSPETPNYDGTPQDFTQQNQPPQYAQPEQEMSPQLESEPEPMADGGGNGDEASSESTVEVEPSPRQREADHGVMRSTYDAMTNENRNLKEQLRLAQEDGERSRERARQAQERLAAAPPASEVKRLAQALETEAHARQEAEADLRLAREEVEHARATESALVGEVEALRAAASAAPDVDPGPLQAELAAAQAELAAANEELARRQAALDEAQAAYEHSHKASEDLARELESVKAQTAAAESLKAQIAEATSNVGNLRSQLAEATANADKFKAQAAEARAAVDKLKAQVADAKTAYDEAQGQITAKDAELLRLAGELAEAQSGGKKGKINAPPADYEVQIKALKKDLATREKEVKETREQLDSESARSFRLSQRRIPALQNELAEAHAQGMELRRKMEKVEAEKRVATENAESLQRQMEELERALQAAKARLADTTMITAPGVAQPSPLDDEIKRLGGRLKAAEEERRKLSESLAQIDKGRRGELDKYEERLAAMQAESNERHESFLGLRKQLKLMAGRLSQALKLAAMLASAPGEDQRRMVLDGIQKLAKETEATGSGQQIELATLAPAAGASAAQAPAPEAASDAGSETLFETPAPAPLSKAQQAPTHDEKDNSNATAVDIMPPERRTPTERVDKLPPPESPALPNSGDLVEPTAEPSPEPMSLDSPSLDPGFDGLPDDIGGPPEM